MEYINKLPVFLAIIFGIITGISAVVYGVNLQQMAVRVSVAITVSYMLGWVLKKILIKMIKEALVRKYLLEEKKRITKKEQANRGSKVETGQPIKG